MKDSKIADNNIAEEVVKTDVESGLADKLIKNSEELQDKNTDNIQEKKTSYSYQYYRQQYSYLVYL